MKQPLFSTRFLVLSGLIVIGALTRLVPHPDNFTAIGAIALLGGARISDKRFAVLIPFLAMMLSDLFLPYGFSPWIYGAFALIVGIGFLLRNRKGYMPVILGSLGASILFFLVSNFGVWYSQGLYPFTLAGLGECYIAAIPFFKNTVLGDLFFSGVFFGGFYLIGKRYPVLAN